MSDDVGKIDLKEQLKSLFNTGINLNVCQVGAIQWAINQVAIPKTETTSCENRKTKTEKKYDDFRSYNIQGDCYKYVCSCIGCGQVLWEIEDYNYMKGERGYKPHYCPNCGRKLKGE